MLISPLQGNEGKAQIHQGILKSSNGLRELFISMVSEDEAQALRMHSKDVLHGDSHHKSQ